MIKLSVFEYLINSLWQLPLLVAATWLVVRIARPAVLVQHMLWLAALALGVLAPLRGIAGNSPATLLKPDLPALLPLYRSTAFPVTSPPPAPLSVARTHAVRLQARYVDWLVELYGVTVAFSLARLVHGYISARRLVATAEAHPLTTLETALLHASATRLELATERLPQLRFLADPASSPMIIGIRRPVLLLPSSLRGIQGRDFDAHAFTAVLLHELAHVRRRDVLANFLGRMAALPIAYHPVTSILQSRIRQTCEMICDAYAAGACESPTAYARSLLALTAGLIHSHPNVEATGLFSPTRSALEERIMKLTEPRLPISFTLRSARIAVGSVVLLAASATAGTLHLQAAAPMVLVAQNQQPAAPPLPQAAPAATPQPPPSPAPQSHSHAHVIVDGQMRDLTPAERAEMEQKLTTAQEQVRKATEHFNDPALKKQMADAQQQVRKASEILNDPAFRKQMADAQEQVRKATEQVNDPAFRKELEESMSPEQSAALASKMEQLKEQFKIFDSPEFKRQMDEAQRAGSALTQPEFQRQFDQLKTQIDSGQLQREIDQATAQAQAALEDSCQRVADASRQADEVRRQVQEETRKRLDGTIVTL